MRLKRALGTIIGVVLSPFLILALLISSLLTKMPNMDCVAKPECKNDCSQCSLYEPKAAYKSMRDDGGST